MTPTRRNSRIRLSSCIEEGAASWIWAESPTSPTSISNSVRAADKWEAAKPDPGEPRESDAAKIRRLEKELANRTEERPPERSVRQQTGRSPAP